MANCKFLSVLSLGLALIIGCGEGADTGTSDANPTGNAGHAMGMEAGSGVGGGAMHEAVAEEAVEGTEEAAEGTEEAAEGTEEAVEGTEEAAEGTEEAE